MRETGEDRDTGQPERLGHPGEKTREELPEMKKARHTRPATFILFMNS